MLHRTGSPLEWKGDEGGVKKEGRVQEQLNVLLPHREHHLACCYLIVQM